MDGKDTRPVSPHGRREDAADQRNSTSPKHDEIVFELDPAHVTDHDHRDAAAAERDVAAERRDLAAARRDRTADERDRDAAAKDRAGLGFRSGSPAVERALHGYFDRSEATRGRAWDDRTAASAERQAAAMDRATARADRFASSDSRRRSTGERDDAQSHRGTGDDPALGGDS